MDQFVAFEKIDTDGKKVGFTFYAFYEFGPAALGWKRVSLRALDKQRSSPGLPVHLLDHEELRSPAEVVPVDIGFWPSSTRFLPNERLRLIVAGADI
ncbi:MAG: CocE/NonD family hydrolase C-terminal non-catalytic domain-containing protein [Alteraurantiacibacter sp.]